VTSPSLKTGARLKRLVCSAEVIMVRAGREGIELRRGSAMVDLTEALSITAARLLPASD
jgi:hypothetical protein